MGKMILNGIEYSGSIPSDSGVIYSDEEREVGVWRDGKPLYQKTFASSYTTTSGTSWQITDIDLSSCNIDTFIDAKALRESGNGLVIFDAITQFGLSTNNYLQILFEVSTPNYTLKYVTLLYTKTTDLPGSGIWTTQGGYAHHYSTSEKVVGTWINGKPLYEKIISVPNSEIIDKDYVYAHGILNIEMPLVVFAFMYNSSDNSSIPMPVISDNDTGLSVRINNQNLFFRGTNYFSANANRTLYVVVQYTKTTD